MEKSLIAQAANPSLNPQGAPVGSAPTTSARPTYYVERNTSTVTLRAFSIGVLLSVVIAWLNCYMLTGLNVSTVGGIQMPFGAIFMLFVLIVAVNPVLKLVGLTLSAVELLTVYVMLMFSGMVSTSGCDNQFMTMGPGLFYFSTRENGWAELFNKHIPTWFSPGWNHATGVVNKDVIDPVYLGGKSFSQIPWGEWLPMLSGWSIFLILTYAVLFFVALLFRKQWIDREALAFPLVQLPMQMVEVDKSQDAPAAGAFWGNRIMWLGFALAISIHLLKGLNAYFPDWPIFPVNNWGGVTILFPDKPFAAMGRLDAKLMLGGVGLAYLLTREVSLSFWFFFLFMQSEMVMAEMLGFPAAGLPKAGIASKPTFIIYQSVGGWTMMALFLFWSVRGYLWTLFTEALGKNRTSPDEPFSARFMVFGFILSIVGLFAWSAFAGINLLMAFFFFGIFLITTLVLTRLVIEGGFIFPQAPYYPLEWMMTATPGLGAKAIGAATLTKLSFVQPTILLDMRTCVLPGFLHVMKIADELKLDSKGLRRMLLCSAFAIIIALVVTFATTLQVLYSKGGLQGYDWFTAGAPKAVLGTAATAIKGEPTFDPSNGLWIGVGAAFVWLLTMARGRFLWFPLHPLGYLAAPAYPISVLWFSFFLGWAIKSIVMKYGGSDTYGRLRPFFIGLILGNLVGMMIWMFIGIKTGVQIPYWCA